MARIHIVVDSTAHIDQELLAQQPDLHVVPLTICLGQQQWREDELSPAQLLALCSRSGSHPQTSQPAPGDFAAVFAPLVAAGHAIIVITLAGALSGTGQSARVAARLVGGDIHIVDSGTTASGMVKMAEAALTLSQQGQTAAAIAGELRRLAAVTHTLFVPDTLEYLHKGGRIGGAAALLGSILQIKPILCLVEGQVTVLDKVRTRAKAIARMLAEVNLRQHAFIGIVHIEAEQEALALKQQLTALQPEAAVVVSSGGAVLAAHLGPGLLGIIYQEAQ